MLPQVVPRDRKLSETRADQSNFLWLGNLHPLYLWNRRRPCYKAGAVAARALDVLMPMGLQWDASRRRQ